VRIDSLRTRRRAPGFISGHITLLSFLVSLCLCVELADFFTPSYGSGPGVWVAGNSSSAQFLAAMPATGPSTSVQGAAFRAGKVHDPGKEVGQSGTYPQDDNQQRNLEKRVKHGSPTSAPPGNVVPVLPELVSSTARLFTIPSLTAVAERGGRAELAQTFKVCVFAAIPFADLKVCASRVPQYL
jgi:hypothetical protein